MMSSSQIDAMDFVQALKRSRHFNAKPTACAQTGACFLERTL
jgi:hypothetical protein